MKPGGLLAALFHPMDVHPFNVLLALLGGILLVLSLGGGLLRIHLFLSEPIVMVLLGIAAGPTVLNWLDLRDWGNPFVLLGELARMTVAVTLVGIAFRLPPRFMMDAKGSLLMLLGFALPGMWLLSSGLYYLVLGLPATSALLLGAIVAPTDPVVASAIVTSHEATERIPRRLRHVISAEAGANDALAFPLVAGVLLFVRYSAADAGPRLLRTIFWESMAAVLAGLLLGYVAGRIMVWIRRRPGVESHSMVSVALSLGLATLGTIKLLRMDGLLAVFVAGITMNYLVRGKMDRGPERNQDVFRQFIDLPIFFFFGLMLPWHEWTQFGWRAFLLPVVILLFRRLPLILLARPWIGCFRGWPDALFGGWFGPIGAAAIYYACHSCVQTGNPTIWPLASLVIFSSVVVHGITDHPFIRLYSALGKARAQPGSHPD